MGMIIPLLIIHASALKMRFFDGWTVHDIYCARWADENPLTLVWDTRERAYTSKFHKQGRFYRFMHNMREETLSQHRFFRQERLYADISSWGRGEISKFYRKSFTAFERQAFDSGKKIAFSKRSWIQRIRSPDGVDYTTSAPWYYFRKEKDTLISQILKGRLFHYNSKA